MPVSTSTARRLTALSAAAVLAGCAHAPQKTAGSDWPMVPAVAHATAVRPVPPTEMSAHPAPVSAFTADSTADGFSVTSIPHPAPTDVFARIRDGYSLAEVDDPAIDRMVRFYAGKPQFLDRTFERGERYLHFVVQELEARHMPLELALLPVIESAYNPYAYSRARAAGIWQFITPTATRHQVRVNWWQDGRRDIMDSTRAALDYLEELHTMFQGDWLLAIAAYNCGENAVARAVQRNEAAGLPTDFWHLKLPTETRGYVPSLLAMARIVKSPEAYGLEFAAIPNRPYFARVEVGGQIDLRVAAAILGVSDEEMHALNPAFNRWATDPDGPYHLLVPAAAAPSFADIVAGLTPEQRLPIERVTLGPKDTLAGLAKTRNLPLAVIQQLNGDAKFSARPGDEIRLPSTLVVAPLRAGLVIEGETAGTTKSRRTAQTLPHHVVRRGETLASIARSNHVEVADLARMNGLKPQATLKPGKRLKLAQTASTTEPAAKAATSKHSKGATAASVATTREIRYQVKKGDTLHALTRKFAVTLDQLKAWNKVGKTITPGDTLVIRVPADRDFGG